MKPTIKFLAVMLILLGSVEVSKAQSAALQLTSSQFVVYLQNLSNSQQKDCVDNLLYCLEVGPDLNSKATQEKVQYKHFRAAMLSNSLGNGSSGGGNNAQQALDCIMQFQDCIPSN